VIDRATPDRASAEQTAYDLVHDAVQRGTPPGVSLVIEGAAGIGKTYLALGVSRLLAALIDQHSSSHRLPDLLLGTAVPIVIIVYMLKFSTSYPERVTGHSTDTPAPSHKPA
jgi:hypothetical protein